MDNLLQKVLVFLTKPESELSIVFLAIFFVCFIYGLYQVISCYWKLSNFAKNAPTEYEKVKEKYTPNIFIQKFEHVIEAKEIKFEDMPNVFVSIGILGTFLGLGVAIQGAAALLSTDKVDLTQLNSVLSVIAFKFQTSVWGTCFSLIFQKLIIENYFVGKRRLIGKTTEELYENEISTRTTLERQLAELRDMQDNFNQYVGNSALFIEHTQDFGNRVQLLKENLNMFNQQLIACLNENQTNLIEHQDKIQQLNCDVLNQGMNTMEAINQKTNDNLDMFNQQLITCLNENQKNLINHQDKIQQLNCDALNQGMNKIEAVNQKNNEFHDAMEYEIANKLEVWQEVFLRSENDYAKETQNALRMMLNQTLDKAHSDYSDAVKKMSDVIEGLNDVLGNMNDQIAKIHGEVIAEHSKFAELNKKTYQSMSKSIISTEANYENKIDQTYAEIKNVCDSLNKSLDEMQDNYNRAVSSLQQTLAQLDQRNSIMQTKFEKEDKAFRESLLKQLGTTQETNTKVSGNLDTAVTHIKTLSKTMSGINKSIEDKDNSAALYELLNDLKVKQEIFQKDLLSEQKLVNTMLQKYVKMMAEYTDLRTKASENEKFNNKEVAVKKESNERKASKELPKNLAFLKKSKK